MTLVGDVVEIFSGYAFKSSLFNDKGEGLPLVRIRDVGKKTSTTFYSGTYKDDYLLNNGDFIIGMDGDFRLAVWEGGKALLNQRVCKVTANDEKIHSRYLYYILPKELKKIEDVTSFATVKHLSAKGIKAIEIPLPPLAEQQKIAAILDAADSLRQKDRKLVEHYTALSQSLFLEMFGDPLHNQKGFMRSALGDVVKIQGGSQPPKKFFKAELLDDYVRLVQIRDYKTDRYLTYVPASSTKKFCTEKDIMIGRYGPPVFQILRGIAGAYNVALMKAIPSSQMDTEYVFHLLSCSYIQNIVIGNSKRTAGQTGVNLKLLNSIEVSVPPIILQNQFAERIKLIEAQKQQAQASLEKSEALFNSLLQRAFTGELTENLAA